MLWGSLLQIDMIYTELPVFISIEMGSLELRSSFMDCELLSLTLTGRLGIIGRHDNHPQNSKQVSIEKITLPLVAGMSQGRLPPPRLWDKFAHHLSSLTALGLSKGKSYPSPSCLIFFVRYFMP